MSNKLLWVAAGILGATAATLAIWARTTYAQVERVQGFYYSMQGLGLAAADRLAESDAADAVGTQVVLAWVFFGVALVAALAALLRRPGQQQPGSATEASSDSGFPSRQT